MNILGGESVQEMADLRVSDADRDRAVSELSDAFQVGRITADEFDQRSTQALRARTGKELTALLKDLPVGSAHARATGVDRALAARIATGAFAAAATALAFLALTNGLSSGPDVAERELARQILAREGLSIPLPAAPGFDWAGTITPAAIAVLLVVLIIVLRVTHASRLKPGA
jgi:Domain of unknown function (DUF1707)